MLKRRDLTTVFFLFCSIKKHDNDTLFGNGNTGLFGGSQ